MQIRGRIFLILVILWSSNNWMSPKALHGILRYGSCMGPSKLLSKNNPGRLLPRNCLCSKTILKQLMQCKKLKCKRYRSKGGHWHMEWIKKTIICTNLWQVSCCELGRILNIYIQANITMSNARLLFFFKNQLKTHIKTKTGAGVENNKKMKFKQV